MTETVKIELSNEEDTLEEIALAFGVPFTADKFRKEVGHILENSKKYHGIFTLPDTSSTTDNLSVEKLQEQLNTAKKALTEIAEFDCSDDCYFTARDALAAIGGEND